MSKYIFYFFSIFFILVPASYGSGEGSDHVPTPFNELLLANKDKNVIKGKEGWLFLREEVEHLAAGEFWGEKASQVSKTNKKQFADPLPAIKDFARQLQAGGVELVLVPIPPKALIYADKLFEEEYLTRISDTADVYKTFYSELVDDGVTVIDLIPAMLAGKKKHRMYCKTDTHFSGYGLQQVAKVVAEEIKKRDWYSSVPSVDYQVEGNKINISGDLATMLSPQGEKESIDLFFVTESDTGKAVKFNNTSPVLLLGDSHSLVFSVGGDLHAKGAGLGENLASELAFAPDLIGVRGSGATPVRIKLYQKSKKDKQWVKSKKVVVWCFAAREFTGVGGWRKVPVSTSKR